MATKSNHYIDKQMFTDAVIAHNEAVKTAIEQGKEPPVIPRYVGECFMLLANKFSLGPKYARYSYREDMVASAVEVCCRKIGNFDPAITQNAFAYFTQVCTWEFWSFLGGEYTEAYVKARAYYNMVDQHGDAFTEAIADASSSDHDVQFDFIPFFDVEAFEAKDAEKRKRLKKAKVVGGLDLDMGGE